MHYLKEINQITDESFDTDKSTSLKDTIRWSLRENRERFIEGKRDKKRKKINQTTDEFVDTDKCSLLKDTK